MITEYRLHAFHSARHVVFVLASIQSIDADDDDDDGDADETKTIASERENKRNRCTNRNAYRKTTPPFSSSLLLSTFHHSISVNNDIINTDDADPFFFTSRTKLEKKHRTQNSLQFSLARLPWTSFVSVLALIFVLTFCSLSYHRRRTQ